MVRFFRSLRFRLIILAVGALLPALGVIIYNGVEMRRQATAAAQDNLRRLVTLVAREQDQKTMAGRQMLMGLTQAPAVRRQEAGDCSALFSWLISDPSLFINIGAIDRGGNIFASGVPTPELLNSSHLPYFQKAMKTGDFAMGNLQIGRIVQKPVLIFSYPVLDAAGEVRTVLYASVGLDWLDELAAQAQLPKDSMLAIIDEQGTIMAKYPDAGKWAGKSLPPGGLIDIIRKHGEGVVEGKGMDGVLRLYAFTPLARDPQLGFVYAGIPTRVIYAAADQALWRNLAVLGGVLLLALGLAWGFGYLFIMRRLNPLVQATERLTAGDLTVRSGLTKGPDELGELTWAFDQMAASLQEREAERRRAEAALRDSEELYRSLFDNMLNGFAYFKMLFEDNQAQDLIFLSVNRSFEPLTGLKDVVGKKVSQVIPGMREADPELFKFFGRVVLTGLPERIEIYVTSLEKWFAISAYSPVKEYFVTVFDVITERKQAEKTLKAAMLSWQTTFDGIGDCIFLMDRESHIVQANRAFLEFMGKPAAELVGRHCWEVVHGTQASIPGCPMLRMRDTRKRESALLPMDGRWFEITVDPILDSEGNLTSAVHILTDITERKLAEAALMESEERLRLFIEHAPASLAMLDKEMRYVRVSRRWLIDYGLGDRDILGLSHYEIFPEIPERWKEVHRRGLAGEVVRSEFDRFDRLDGSVQWLRWEVRPWYDASGGVGGILMFTEDITFRKQAEEALQSSEAFLKESQWIAHIGSWSVNLTDNIIRWSDEMYRIYGVTKEEFHNTPESFMKLLHPDDRPLMERWIEATLAQRHPEELDFRIVRPDGTIRYIRGSGDLITDQADKPVSMVGTAQDITERKQVEAERERLALAIEQAAEVVVITDATGIIQYINPAFETVTGYTRQAALGRTSRLFKDRTREEEPYRTMWETVAVGKTWVGHFVDRKNDDTPYTAEVKISPVRDGAGSIVNYVAVMHDITEHLRMSAEKTGIEAQLHQAQKMDAVGRLAGGVAHDFNNMLGVIIGHAEMALMQVSATDPLQHNLQEINEAAQRSADLTRQLLAFARQQTVKPQVLDLNETMSGMLKMLRRLIGEDIDLAWMPGHDLWKVKIDPSQIDQILANLAVNARDAIAGVGKLTTETSNMVLDAAYCTDHAEFVPGEYVLLAVSDDGCGINQEILDHIFEPFFTTKGIGEGTGLGLATVYGIIKQNDGFINVYSEPGHGAIFKIYLPRCQAEAAQDQAEAAAEPLQRGSETVLLVEDEKAILDIGQAILEQLGYKVLTAGTPGEAIRLAGERTGGIQLLISDVVMPGMNGRELAERLMAMKPGLKCLYMSGYTTNVIAHRGILDEGVHFLQKPFSMRALATKVREVLED